MLFEVVGPGRPVWIGQVGESGGEEVGESPLLDRLGPGGSVGILAEVEGRGLLNAGVWIGLVGESDGGEVVEWSLPGRLVAPGAFGLLIEVGGRELLDDGV